MDKLTEKNQFHETNHGEIDNSVLNLTRRQFLAFAAAMATSGFRLHTIFDTADVVVIEGVGRTVNVPATLQIKNSLERAVSRLAGQRQTDSPWKSLFGPGDSISIKVDARSPLAFTSSVLIGTLLEQLFDLGIQPWDVSVWDKRISDVKGMTSGITTRRGIQKISATEAANQNDGDPGGYRQDEGYLPGWLNAPHSQTTSLFSGHLPKSGIKIINLPTAKQHPIAGIDGALLSLAFGGINNVNRFWSSPEILARAVAEIWKTKALSDHVLTIMDATRLLFHGGPVGLPSWTAETGALIVGFDPVAVDSVALEMIEARRKTAQFPPLGEEGKLLLKEAEEQGIGKTQPSVIHLSAYI